MLDMTEQEIWDAASRWVEREIGLHFPPAQWRDLQRGLGAAAVRLGLPDALACGQWLLQGNVVGHAREVLVDCLAIRETYFFRDPRLFAQLAAEVLEPLIESRRSTTRHLRLWSAGCATGEEPYSLAMLVASLLPQWRDWNISILGTDLNAAALERARAGSYGPWSVRGGVPELARPYLRPRPGGRHEVDEGLRRIIRFEALNLVTTGDFPPSARSMDLVVCRNVLMYFAPHRRASVLRRLCDAVTDDGWLVTNPVEVPAAGVAGMTVVISRGLVALRRGAGRDRSHCGAGAAGSMQAKARATAAPAGTAGSRAAHRRVPSPLLPAAVPPVPEVATAAAAVADREVTCRRAMLEDKLDPEWPYLLACILSERGADDEAATALQRTLFLAPEHVLAHFGLGSIAARQGRAADSRRHFTAALGRLSALPPGEVVPGSGGMTSRELARVIGAFVGGV